MAIYHASTKPIARSAGRSAVAAAAYRAGVELVDARTGLVHDYTRKGGVELTEILTPDGLGVERNALWNAAELAEKRKDARTAREWIVALPAELDAGQRCDLARDFAQALVARYGVAVDLVIHAPDREGDHRNHHAHLLTTTRQFSRAPDGGLILSAKAHIELSDKARRERSLGAAADEVKAVRELWEHTANAALERAGVEARIDARSLQAQGVDREATQHLGPVASEMERRGKESDRGDGNREVSVNNEERARLSAEIIDLQAERERRERREAARREFEASHREVRPDFRLTDRVVAGAVVQSARRERADIQLRWNDRWRRNEQAEKERQAQRQEAARLATIEAERETRRQKLLDLAETLRTDKEAKANLRQAYLSAGYQLEERDGKEVWVYPHTDLKAEKDAAYAARQEWDARKQALKAQRLEQDRATEQEIRPGIRHPQRSTWQAWRAQTLTRKYNPAYSAEMAERDIYCRWMPEDGGLYLRLGKAEVIDQGPLILAKNGTGDIPLMIDTAQAKGWESLEFTGDARFQEQAAMAALRAGLKVADMNLARRAREAIAEQAKPVIEPEYKPSSVVVPGIRYLVEETADHAPMRDKHGEIMLFDTEAQAFEVRKILGFKYPIVPISVEQEPTKPAPVKVSEKPSPDLTDLEARRQKLVELVKVLSADAVTKIEDVRKAYLAAGYVVEPREGGAVFVYPPGDLPEARKAVTQARKDWKERANRSGAQREPMVPKAQINAYGAEYARRDGWKGTFTGAVIAVDEGHVYVGAKGGGGAPHFVAIPKERFKAQPSVGLYATFTQGDAERPAGWSKVLGKMNGQGRLVRDQEKGKGIGD
ncbi:MobQ family relaxase [Acidithiobacillus sp. HP-11]|uniref:MobQ family relaxase n=1 Tax=Acidithiobacillus sp. HP-11 TaxID=2697656 RepID=UPI001879FC28|nr:MobQ family relaxase [Acidithiobacillus sp. HP-11]MBE7567506.1 MobA/MobL family protein [Acidithiobacillus sp. HP-11]